jgi:hypothetical protein
MLTALAKQLSEQYEVVALPQELWEMILVRATAQPSFTAVHAALWPYLEAFSEKPPKWSRLRKNPKGLAGFVRSLVARSAIGTSDSALAQLTAPSTLVDALELPTAIAWHVTEQLRLAALTAPEEKIAPHGLEESLLRRAGAICEAAATATAQVHPGGPPPRKLLVWSNRETPRRAVAILVGVRLWLSAPPTAYSAFKAERTAQLLIERPELSPKKARQEVGSQDWKGGYLEAPRVAAAPRFEQGEVDDAIRACFASECGPDCPAIRRYLLSVGVLVNRCATRPNLRSGRRIAASRDASPSRYEGSAAEQQAQHSRAPTVRLDVALLREAAWRERVESRARARDRCLASTRAPREPRVAWQAAHLGGDGLGHAAEAQPGGPQRARVGRHAARAEHVVAQEVVPHPGGGGGAAGGGDGHAVAAGPSGGLVDVSTSVA